jgi:hypothetical protein
MALFVSKIIVSTIEYHMRRVRGLFALDVDPWRSALCHAVRGRMRNWCLIFIYFLGVDQRAGLLWLDGRTSVSGLHERVVIHQQHYHYQIDRYLTYSNILCVPNVYST